MQKKIVIIILALIAAIAVVSFGKQNGFASTTSYDYSLAIYTHNGSPYMDEKGVDIYVENTQTGYNHYLGFTGLPPYPVYTYWYDYEFPIDSYFKVCAYYHDTGNEITCRGYQSDGSMNEWADLNLRP